MSDTSDKSASSPKMPSTRKGFPLVLVLFVVALLILCCLISVAIGWFVWKSRNTLPPPTPMHQQMSEVTSSPTAAPSAPSTPTPTEGTDQPAAPKGFTWADCRNMQSHFLLPNGWYKYEEQSPGLKDSYSCYLTKEPITSGQSQFMTGMTVNFIMNVSKNSKQKPTAWAKDFIGRIAQKYPSNEQTQNLGDGKPFTGYGRSLTTTEGTYPLQEYVVAFGNDSADQVYVIYFESPASEWNTAWLFGYQMVYNLGLYAP